VQNKTKNKPKILFVMILIVETSAEADCVSAARLLSQHHRNQCSRLIFLILKC
jgi:hypothetical protein